MCHGRPAQEEVDFAAQDYVHTAFEFCLQPGLVEEGHQERSGSVGDFKLQAMPIAPPLALVAVYAGDYSDHGDGFARHEFVDEFLAAVIVISSWETE